MDPDQQRIIIAFDNYGNINSAAQDVKSGFFHHENNTCIIIIYNL